MHNNVTLNHSIVYLYSPIWLNILGLNSLGERQTSFHLSLFVVIVFMTVLRKDGPLPWHPGSIETKNFQKSIEPIQGFMNIQEYSYSFHTGSGLHRKHKTSSRSYTGNRSKWPQSTSTAKSLTRSTAIRCLAHSQG